MTSQNQYLLFLDLDGVLVDFEKGVEVLFNRPMEAISARQLWSRLARTPDFYNTLDWMADGKLLWTFCMKYSPVILTGLPMGKWAEPQKRRWCARELGANVEVITCLSRHKAKVAAQRAAEKVPILVDDREKLRQPFEEIGGVFIHHRDASASVDALSRLGL